MTEKVRLANIIVQDTLSTKEGNINNAGERTGKHRLARDTLELEICNQQRDEALEESSYKGQTVLEMTQFGLLAIAGTELLHLGALLW